MGWIEDQLEKEGLLTAKKLYNKFGFQHVIGMYLYGRRALAGPICLCALILKPTHKLELSPSDKLNSQECNKLNDRIRKKATMLTMGWASVGVIARIGVHQATMTAINTCLAGVSSYNPPSMVFIDNFQMDPLPNGLRDSMTPVVSVKKGKEKVDSIMAASIVARVGRETLMKFMHDEYPEYDWINNGGFATQQHIDLIKQYGISPYHRDLSNVKALREFKAFPNKTWRKKYENSYFG